MKLQDILSSAGKHSSRKRIGKGGSRGGTSGRGHKGAGARAGSTSLFGYEGGQNPTLSRIPKRGFNNANFRTEYQLVKLADLEVFEDGQRVDAVVLADRKLIRRGRGPVKILANGGISKKLTVVADGFSKAAVEKIEAAGGTAVRVS